MQTDIEQMYIAFSLGAMNLREIISRRDLGTVVTADLEKALDLLHAAASLLEPHVDKNNILVSKDRLA